MPPLASPTTWRKRHSVRGFLYVHNPTVVFKARVNHPEGTVYPTREILFDTVTVGADTDIKAGMTLLLGTTNGADDLGRQRVKSADTTTIQIGWTSIGSHDGELVIPDNAFITVIDEYRVWTKTPYIELVSGTNYKDFDIGFDADTAQPPVANGGIAYAEFVDPDTDVITVDFTAANSFAVHPSATIDSYLWDVVDGTITVGTDTDEEITATFPAGFRYVSLTVTDSGARTHTTRIPVFAAEKTGDNAPIYDFDADLQFSAEGGKARFTVRESLPYASYPDGTLVLFWVHEYYDNTLGSLAGQTGREHMRFIGFIHHEPTSVQAEENLTRTETVLECLDAAGKLATLPGFPQALTRVSAPTNWYEMQAANADRFIHYLLYWHSTVLEVTDFYWTATLDTYAFGSFSSDGQNLYQQVDGRARATGTGYRLTSDSQGIMRLMPDPQHQETGERVAVNAVELTEADLISYRYRQQRPPRFHWLRTSAIKVTTTELTAQDVVFSIAPGAAPGQGESAQELGNRLVTGQAQLNIFTGNVYARENAPQSEFDFEFVHGGFAGIEPALLEWIEITTTAQFAPERGLVFTEERFLPLSVSMRFDSRTGAVSQSINAEREVVGELGVTFVPPQVNLPGYTPPETYFGTIDDASDTGFLGGSSGALNFAFFATDGFLYRGDFSIPEASGGGVWEQVTISISGTPRSFSVDAYSPKYLGTGTEVNGWLATADGSSVYLYYIEDIAAATPTVTLKFTSASAPYAEVVSIASERMTQDFVIAVWYDNSVGVKAAYSTDNTTFTEVTVSAFLGTDTVHFGTIAVIGGGLAYAGAYSVTGAGNAALGKVYKTLDSGATWNISHGTLLGERGLCIHVPFHNNPSRNKMWYTKWDWSGGSARQQLFYYDGTSEFNRAPEVGGCKFGAAATSRSIATNPNNSSQVALAGWGNDGSDHHRVFMSNNTGQDWTALTEDGNDLYGIDIDANGNLYVWGVNILSYFSYTDYLEDSRMGNLVADFAFNAAVVGVLGL